MNLFFFSKGYCIWELLHTSLTLWICEVNETSFLLTRKKYFCKNQKYVTNLKIGQKYKKNIDKIV
jgi:hypothetical protein